MQGCLEDAGSCLEQSLALARATGDHASEAYASYGLGEVRRQQGRLEEAAGYLSGLPNVLHVTRGGHDRLGGDRSRGRADSSGAWLSVDGGAMHD
jgi:hypothetical protein